jgi:hypothetical protein
MATFNKRIEPLLVCFGDEVREHLIVTKPEDRGLFTKAQCDLINGYPMGDGDQDDLKDVLKISEPELNYWGKRGLSPDYIYEFASEGWEDKMMDISQVV